MPPLPEWLSDLAKKGGELPGMANDAKEKAERDARFVGDWSDELTVAISLKEWNKAVALIEDRKFLGHGAGSTLICHGRPSTSLDNPCSCNQIAHINQPTHHRIARIPRPPFEPQIQCCQLNLSP